MSNVYFERLTCWNCGKQENVEIPKGINIDDFCNKNKCSNCGCHRRLKEINSSEEK